METQTITQNLPLEREDERVIDAVIMVVADVFICDESDLLYDKMGERYISEARHAMYLLLHDVYGNKKKIGQLLNRDRKGIQYGIFAAQERIKTKPYFAECYKTCGRLLKPIL